MRRFRQKLYRTRIGARQKQPFLNHLQLIINFFTCFSQTTLEKLSLIGAASEAPGSAGRLSAGARIQKGTANQRLFFFTHAARGFGGRRSRLPPKSGAEAPGRNSGAGIGEAEPVSPADLRKTPSGGVRGRAEAPPRQYSPRTYAYRTPRGPPFGIVAARF